MAAHLPAISHLGRRTGAAPPPHPGFRGGRGLLTPALQTELACPSDPQELHETADSERAWREGSMGWDQVGTPGIGALRSDGGRTLPGAGEIREDSLEAVAPRPKDR